jgi:hypothetical protein
MGGKKAESCGRCSMSATSELLEDADDPYGEECIEVEEDAVRTVSPAAWLEGAKERIDRWATSLTYGR